MKPIVTFLLSIVLLAAAEAGGDPLNGVPAGQASQDPRDAHVNRHVEAHVPARSGDTGDREEPVRRRSSTDSFRGITQPTQPALPSTPFAGQPLRDRRF